MARNQKKRPPKKNTQTPKTPWFKVSIALLIIALFVYGLWRLVNSEAPTQSTQTTEVETSDIVKQEHPPLPELKDEEWEFIEGLPNYSVEVDEQTQQASDKRYLMQCGSFRKESQAEVLKAQIAFQGLESQVLQSQGTTGLWFRVVLGPFESKRDAERDRHTLRRGNINSCKIWLWN